MAIMNPIIQLIPDNKRGLKILSDYLDLNDDKSKLIRDYPTVYIHNWENSEKYEVYVGESNDFFQRTQQHFDDINKQNSWQKNIKEKRASLYVIAHPEFNKSLTLDVENRLIHYLSSCSSIAKVHNARGNPQNEYYPCEDFDGIFTKIWKTLRRYNKALFLSESEIKDSAIYKASPLHKLNFEQKLAKELIVEKISECLINNSKQLVFVRGDAGTGKTVLMSSIFYDVLGKSEFEVSEDNKDARRLDAAVIVNHVEQLVVYDEIARKLDLCKENEKIVFNPTQFINQFKHNKRDKIYDVVFVDEAHLLLTQNNQAFTDNNQLQTIMKYAKVVCVMFDEKQIMNATQYISQEEINAYIRIAKSNNAYIELKEQMRMIASKEVTDWIKTIYRDGKLSKLSNKRNGYDIKVFDNPRQLEKAIKEKASVEKTALSRIIASYDWPYSGMATPKNSKYWCVKIGDWEKPWNRELIRHETSAKEKRKNKNLAWAEQPNTINEVGSTYTIQGFDLNYAGVIIGPSIKYRNGKIVFDPSCSCNDRATHKRRFDDGSCMSFGEEFLRNELGVLLTRGVNGLYIYACDEELRNMLKKCI